MSSILLPAMKFTVRTDQLGNSIPVGLDWYCPVGLDWYCPDNGIYTTVDYHWIIMKFRCLSQNSVRESYPERYPVLNTNERGDRARRTRTHSSKSAECKGARMHAPRAARRRARSAQVDESIPSDPISQNISVHSKYAHLTYRTFE